MHTVKRLITEFIPKHYDLKLQIDRVGRSFTGIITIEGTTLHDTILLHANGLHIKQAAVDGKTCAWSTGEDDELSFAAEGPGDHTLVIEYSGKINDQLHGLYPCKYEYDGQQKELLATQFESHYAREVLPCVDEPAAKATFDVTLVTEQNVTVLGNMPVKDSVNTDDTLVTSFETTPKMSPYLLAFVIGDLQKKSGTTKDGVEVNVYATPAQPADSLDFALEHAIKTIEFFDEYFGVPYPLPKSDQVALPDFANGAMENWGLITYRESCLLYDPKNTSIADKQYISTVISHELSHQWFGNLVTMAWWDDLWLNESFATIMEYICVDALHPEWKVWLDFNTNESVYALRRDSLDGVQPVKVPVHHPDEVQSVFDGAIVYAKGARLMQMMRNYVGESAFKQGLHDYFTTQKYGNTTGDDLWSTLGKTSGKEVGSFMSAWLTQSGFPVVHAIQNGGSLQLTQRQFFIGPHGQYEKLWPIPLDSTASSLPAIFADKAGTFPIDPARIFRLNVHDTAHFITKYDDMMYERILETVTHSDVIARAQVIKDQSLLAKSPEAGTDTLVDLLRVYTAETDEKVWGMISGVIGDLKRFVDLDSAAEKSLKRLASTLAAPLYAKLGWQPLPNESEDDTILRSTIIGSMLYAEDPDAIAEARKRYNAQPAEAIDPELRGLIMAAEIRHGDTEKAITALLHTYKATASVDLRSDICDAVTGTREPAQITYLLGLLKDTALIRTQDTAMWYVRLLSNRYARGKTWQWMRDNWDWIKQTFGGDKSYDAFPRYTAQVLAARDQLDEYKTFFEPMLDDPGLKLAISVGINDITARVELIESDKAAVEQKLIEF